MSMMTTLNYRSVALAVSLALGLSACGDSDLERQQLEVDKSARDAQLAAKPGDNSTPPAPEAPSPVLDGVNAGAYTMVFRDEFESLSLDSQKWRTALPWGPDLSLNAEQQYYVDVQHSERTDADPFLLDGQTLTILADETPANWLIDANQKPYLSGVLSSADRFEMTYGHVEARIRLPQGTGLWPAFWMLSSQFVGVKPQVFIMEYDGGQPGKVFHNYNYHDSDDNLRSPGQWEVDLPGIDKGFHVFGLSWGPEELIYYIDGKPRYRIIGDNVPNQAMYLIFNLAVGGVWTGAPDDNTVFPAGYTIDYVRAWSAEGE